MIPIIDMHCDTLSVSLTNRNKGQIPDLRIQDTQINFTKMKENGYALQNFAAFVDLGEDADPLETALLITDLFYEQTEANDDLIAPVTTWKEIEKNMACGKMSALLSLEEGGICKGNPNFLSILHRLGARMMTLTWNYENELGFPNFDMRYKKESASDSSMKSSVYNPGDTYFENLSHHGLKERGIAFLAEMERLSMIIDVSHLSDAGIYDVLEHTRKPFVASHSNARGIWPAKRNLTDDLIRKMADRGCVTGINFCQAFLGRPDPGKDHLDQAIKQMIYLMDLGGENFVGLGSDFDGITVYDDFKDCSVMPLLIDRMEKAGFTSRQIEKICYKNVLNVYKELL